MAVETGLVFAASETSEPRRLDFAKERRGQPPATKARGEKELSFEKEGQEKQLLLSDSRMRFIVLGFFNGSTQPCKSRVIF